jgi:dTDP-4-dehydrorhamnose 3,5-epimerase
MLIEPTEIPDVLLITPKVFRDSRGYFLESFNNKHLPFNFVQDNQSFSLKNTIRGLHYQVVKPQGKLIRAIKGRILDVAVDIRKDSPTFRKHVAVELSSDNFKQLYIPEGFAHGFSVLSDEAEVLYKTTDYWYKDYERSLNYNDPELNIDWKTTESPILSDKDRDALMLKDAELFR